MRWAFVHFASIWRMCSETTRDAVWSTDAYILSIKGDAAEFEVDATARRPPINVFDYDSKTEGVMLNADPLFSVSDHCPHIAKLKP